MSIGDRIKKARVFRGMTQKELGIAVGFNEKNADIRIAQYEGNTRRPKSGTLNKIAEVLDVGFFTLYEPYPHNAENIMYSLLDQGNNPTRVQLEEVLITDGLQRSQNSFHKFFLIAKALQYFDRRAKSSNIRYFQNLHAFEIGQPFVCIFVQQRF